MSAEGACAGTSAVAGVICAGPLVPAIAWLLTSVKRRRPKKIAIRMKLSPLRLF